MAPTSRRCLSRPFRRWEGFSRPVYRRSWDYTDPLLCGSTTLPCRRPGRSRDVAASTRSSWRTGICGPTGSRSSGVAWGFTLVSHRIPKAFELCARPSRAGSLAGIPAWIRTEMANEIFYNFLARFYRFGYPFFRSGCYYNPFVEYFTTGAVYRINAARREAHAGEVVEPFACPGVRSISVPCSFSPTSRCLRTLGSSISRTSSRNVISSFAAHAPAGSILLFKEHPHDNGVEKWGAGFVTSRARYGVGERVEFIRVAIWRDPATRARLRVGKLYGRSSRLARRGPDEGAGDRNLRHGGFDRAEATRCAFWADPATPVDMDLLRSLIKVMAGTIQVQGSFNKRAGKAAAIKEIVRRLTAGAV